MGAHLAILNGFGRTLGDGIIGLQALHAVRARGVLNKPVVLYRLPGLPKLVQALYAAAPAEILELPWNDAAPGRPFAADGCAKAIDLRDFAFDPGFRGVAMIDYFLAALGDQPSQVPAALKRNTWLAPTMNCPKAAHNPYVLVCPRSAMTLRDMPERVHLHILDWLARNTDAPVLTQATLPPAADLAALCTLVAGARLLISTDTAMVHLADAFSVPCLAFFTTHRPEWRVRDYPLCRSVYLPVAGLPPALEFARDDSDIIAAQAAWTGGETGLHWLTAALARAWEKWA